MTQKTHTFKNLPVKWQLGIGFSGVVAFFVALLRNSIEGRTAPDPRRIYPTRTVSGVPSCVNRFKMAARTCSSAT